MSKISRAKQKKLSIRETQKLLVKKAKTKEARLVDDLQKTLAVMGTISEQLGNGLPVHIPYELLAIPRRVLMIPGKEGLYIGCVRDGQPPSPELLALLGKEEVKRDGEEQLDDHSYFGADPEPTEAGEEEHIEGQGRAVESGDVPLQDAGG